MARQTPTRIGPDVKRGSLRTALPSEFNELLEREWLVTNGLGSYASSTIPGCNTRKYHGLLVAAMSPPAHRMVLLSRTEETVVCDGAEFQLDCNEYPGTIHPRGERLLKSFAAHPNPKWRYVAGEWELDRELRLIDGQNTVVLTYTNRGNVSFDLAVRPLLGLRSIHSLTYQWNGRLRAEKFSKNQIHIPATSRTPEVFIAHDGAFSAGPNWYLNQIYRCEERRGYAALEDVWTPGAVRYTLEPEQSVHLVCSAAPIDWPVAIRSREVRPASDEDPLALLSDAAQQFIVRCAPTGQVASVAGYPWLEPSPRAQLISFTGMFLVTGRFDEARQVLLNMAGRFENGLLAGQAADVSLWFINAVWDYHRYTNDAQTTRKLIDAALKIIHAFRSGAARDVQVSEDGLIAYRPEASPATWMDVRVHGQPLTPRHGKAVETNALWYNALRIVSELAEPSRRRDGGSLRVQAELVFQSFNAQFWNAATESCFDVLDGDTKDASVRPNQLLALSLVFAVLDASRHRAALETTREQLLTPMGVRTLSPSDARYTPRCEGPVELRERACFNGAAHPWLLAQFVRALSNVIGTRRGAAEARALLGPILSYVQSAGNGQLPEVFDGDASHSPGGARASAVSVCELLRCFYEEVLGRGPKLPAVRSSAPALATDSTGLGRRRHGQHSSASEGPVLSPGN